MKIDDLLAAVGEDLRTITLERVLELVQAEARAYAGRAMAAVKLNKAERLVTHEEARDAFAEPEAPGDRDLSAKTLRAGERATIQVLAERGFYPPSFAALRVAANLDLDRGEVSVISMPAPTRKRQAGRPSRSVEFARMLAVDVYFRLHAGQASSVEKIIEQLTGRDRHGVPVPGIAPIIVLPSGKKSHRTVTSMLQAVAGDAPSLIAEARRQGSLVKAGGAPDPEFYRQLLSIRAILGTPTAVKSMLRTARRRKN